MSNKNDGFLGDRFKRIIKGRDVQYCTEQPPIKVFLNGRCFFFSIESYNIRENE